MLYQLVIAAVNYTVYHLKLQEDLRMRKHWKQNQNIYIVQ